MGHERLLAIGGAYVDINAPNFPLGPEGLSLETEVVGSEYLVEAGGSAVNFARMCAALELPTTFIGKVGHDEFGGILSSLLQEAGVVPSLIVSDSVRTNIGFNMINDGGDSVMAVVGTANQSLTADEVYGQAFDTLADSAYLFLGGCFKLRKLLPAFEKLAQDAKQLGVTVVLDHGRVTNDVTDLDKAAVRKLALVSDIYLPSDKEFRQLWGVSSIEEGLNLLSKTSTKTLTVVKNGAQGAVTNVKGVYETYPAYSVQPIHTIGAGDSFNAGFIASLHKGQDIPASIQFACATAALKLSQPSLPTYTQIDTFVTNIQ